MAVARLPTTAHQRESMRLRAAQDSSDCAFEFRLGRHRSVKGVSFGVVVPVVARATTQRFAQKEVADATRADRGLQLLAVEMGRVARVRIGTHIHEEVDPVVEQQLGEPVRLVVRMPNGPEKRCQHHPGSSYAPWTTADRVALPRGVRPGWALRARRRRRWRRSSRPRPGPGPRRRTRFRPATRRRCG